MDYHLKLQNKRIAILLETQYQELEVWYPYFRLIEEGAEVHFIAPKIEEYKGKYGYPLTPHLTINQAKSENYDAVIIPGGFAPDFMRRTPAMIEFVHTMHAQNKLIAAICHGGWILASANIIKGKNITCFSAIKDDLINAGANYYDKEVVKDGNIITSRKPEDLPAFCHTIIESL